MPPPLTPPSISTTRVTTWRAPSMVEVERSRRERIVSGVDSPRRGRPLEARGSSSYVQPRSLVSLVAPRPSFCPKRGIQETHPQRHFSTHRVFLSGISRFSGTQASGLELAVGRRLTRDQQSLEDKKDEDGDRAVPPIDYMAGRPLG